MKWFTSWGYIGGGAIILIMFSVLMLLEPEGFHIRAIFGVLLAIWALFRGFMNLWRVKKAKIPEGKDNDSITGN